jgi:hypothetical protein
MGSRLNRLLGAQHLAEQLTELGGVCAETGVPAGEVDEFRAGQLGQEGGGTIGQFTA